MTTQTKHLMEGKVSDGTVCIAAAEDFVHLFIAYK
jgi:hypothetical protein